MKKKFFILLILFVQFNLITFTSLKRAEEYAHKKTEYPDSDNQNWLDPDYSNFIESQRPDIFQKFLNYFKFNKQAKYWSPREFNKNILDVTKIYNKLPKNINLEILDDTKFIILGSIGGAYHSLVRDLKELEKRKILTNDLQLTSKNIYLIFMGNTVGSSPYNMETIFLITNLIKKNSDRVLYLEGQQEYRLNWADKTFGKELKIEGVLPTKKKASLQELVKNFFISLPHTVIINLPNSKESILISYLTKPDNHTKSKYPVKLEFHSDSPKKEFPEEGYFVTRTKDKETVQILSSPTRPNRYLYSIKNDNFAILDIKNGKIDIFQICSKIASDKTAFKCKTSQELKIKTTIKPKEKSFKEITQPKEQAIATGSEKILLGSTMDITKSNNIISLPLKQGLSLKLNQQNTLGGINGQLLQLIVLDDQYTPQLARRNIEKLINEDKTNIIISPVGSPTLAASLDLIQSKKILVLFSNSGSPLFRTPELTNIINFRVSYVDESKALISHITKTYSPKRIAFLYQNDEYGIPPTESSIKQLTAMGFDENNILKIPYSRNDINIQGAIKKIIEFGPDTIGFFALPFVGGELIRQMGPSKLANIRLFGISPMGEETFLSLLKTYGVKMIISSIVPNPVSSQLDIVKEYREDAKKQGILNYYNIYMLEGYIDMCITIEIFKRIKNNINIDSIIKSAQSFKNFDFKGLKLNYNPENQQLNNKLWIDTGEYEWLEITV